jgi:hypothetical protein
MLVIVSDTVPVFVRVAFFTALVVPTGVLAKLMLVVESVTCCAVAATVSSRNASPAVNRVTLRLPKVWKRTT